MMIDYSQPPVPPAQPIIEPPPIETPPIETPPVPSVEGNYSEGGMLSPAKIEMAQLFVFGLITASFIYSILYYRKQFNQLSKIDKLEKSIEEIRLNMKKNA